MRYIILLEEFLWNFEREKKILQHKKKKPVWITRKPTLDLYLNKKKKKCICCIYSLKLEIKKNFKNQKKIHITIVHYFNHDKLICFSFLSNISFISHHLLHLWLFFFKKKTEIQEFLWICEKHINKQNILKLSFNMWNWHILYMY